jgi:GTPase
MTEAERATVEMQIAEMQAKAIRFDELQKEIARHEAAKGKAVQVKVVTNEGDVIGIEDDIILSKVDAALDKVIADMQAERDAL